MICNGCAKLSLLTFYLQLSPIKWFRITVWTCIAIVASLTLVITFLLYFLCTPIQAAYDITIQGKCLDAGVLYMATAVSNIVTDVMLFVIPIPTVLSLQMGKRQKIGAMIIFAIGSMYVDFLVH